MTKCKGGCQMRAGGKTCKKCGCDMEDEEYEKGEKEMRSGGMSCMKCGGKMHKSGGTVSSCMKCGGGKYTFGGKVKWTKKYANGGMVNECPPGFMKIGNNCVDIKTVMNIFQTQKQFGMSDEELLRESLIDTSQQYKMPGLSEEELLRASEIPLSKPQYYTPDLGEQIARTPGKPQYYTPNYIDQINFQKKKK